jgi:hypothetical protein
MPQKIELLITTADKTSIPASFKGIAGSYTWKDEQTDMAKVISAFWLRRREKWAA